MRMIKNCLAACFCIVLLLCCVPAAQAAGHTADCPHCDEAVTWTAWDGATVPAAGHYYLAEETVTVSSQKSLPTNHGDVVIDLNGNTLQLASAKRRMFLLYSGAKLTFLDSKGGGTVISNQSTASHSGIAQISGGELNIYGGTFKMTDGSNALRGGLIYAYSGAKVNIYGGEFHGIPVAENGGIIYLSDAALNIQGGTFYPGSLLDGATGGDSMYIYAVSAEVAISGDPVIYGGIDVVSAKSFTVSGKPVIQNAEGGSAYSIRLASGRSISVGALEEGARIGLTGSGDLVTGYPNTIAEMDHFVADEAGKVVVAKGPNLVVAEASSATTFDCAHCDETVSWQAWDGTTALAAGHYYLADNTKLALDMTLSDAGTVVLNLNGYTLSKVNDGRMFLTQGEAQLVLMDSSADQTGTLFANAGNDHGMIAMANSPDSSVTIHGGNFVSKESGNTDNRSVLAATSGGTLEIRDSVVCFGDPSADGDLVYATGEQTRLIIGGATVIQGDVNAEKIASFTLEGAPQIYKTVGSNMYSLRTETKLTVGTLQEGAKILLTPVQGQTVFTEEFADVAAAQAARKFFSSEDHDKIVKLEGKALSHVVSAPAPADSADQEQLSSKYVGTTAYHGEMHDHSDSGGTSDGKVTLDVWKEQMAELKMDFATLVDHRQASHMRHELWDNALFVGGSEASTTITDLQNATQSKCHFNMIFSQPEQLEKVVYQFYNYNGVKFSYINFPRATLEELVKAVKKAGGMFVHVHPKSSSYIISDDPLNYFFGNDTGLEVYYSYKGYNMNTSVNQKNYKLWTDLLALGKRVWATAGHDGHKYPSVESLTTIYAEQKHADSLVAHMRIGDFTAGAIGIRMSIGDVKGGAQTEFKAGDRLVLAIGDFHESLDATHTYRVDVVDDRGQVYRQLISSTEMNWLAFDVDPAAKFYRAEIYDTTLQRQIAFGQPIWNSTYQEDEPIKPDPEPAKCPHCDQLVEWTSWNGTSAPAAGHYILESETVEVDDVRTLSSGDVVIDLNGNTLKKTTKNRVFLVTKNAKLIIFDSSAKQTGTVIGYQGSGGHAGIIQLKGGSLDIYSGTFKMTEDSAALRGGLIYAYKDTNVPLINIYGGTFYGNKAERGGVIATSQANLNIEGGTFYAGSILEGGTGGDTIYVGSSAAVVTISGDPVIYGGIQIDSAASVTLSGKPVIQKAEGGSAYSLKLASGKLLTLGALESGTSIGITAEDGAFTAELADETSAAAIKAYFTADDSEKAVLAEGKALAIGDKPAAVRGDLNGDNAVSDADAMYLLRYTLFGEVRYPLNQSGDMNGDGAVSDADAMYLLRYTLFGEVRYPLA